MREGPKATKGEVSVTSVPLGWPVELRSSILAGLKPDGTLGTGDAVPRLRPDALTVDAAIIACKGDEPSQ